MTSDWHGIVSRHAYGVVDPAMRALVPHGVRLKPLVPRRLAGSAHLMPALIDLGTAGESWLLGLLDERDNADPDMKMQVVAVLLKTTVGMDEVERRWNSMQLASPGSGSYVWLRMHDPRVLHQTLRILSPAQCRRLFGRIDAITYRIGGEWVEREIRSGLPQGGSDSGSDALTRRDWGRIARIGTVNRALQRAGIRDRARLDRCSETVEEALDRAASRYGLLEVEDLTEFAFRTLTCRSSFDEDQRVAAALTQHASNRHDAYLSDHFALIDPEIWRALQDAN